MIFLGGFMLDLNIVINRDFIEATFTGIINRTNADDVISKLSKVTIENSINNWIMDVRNLDLQVGIAEAFFYIPKLSYAISKNIALVVNNEKKDFYSFFEVATNNRGMNIRHYDSVEKAKTWLNSIE